MDGVYRVPLALRQAREARKLPMAERIAARSPGPSELYFSAKAGIPDGDERLVAALYLHAMYEIGFIGPPGTTDNKAFEGMPVCPICGFVFEVNDEGSEDG